MNREPDRLGAKGPLRMRSRQKFAANALRRGVSAFTLLEMIMVLVILAIMAGLSIPSIQTAFTEQAVRKDSHQLALMVKTAMIKTAEQHRNYEIDLSPTEMALHPVGQTAADPDAEADSDTADDTTPVTAAPVDVSVTSEIDSANKLQTPDLTKVNAWVDIPPTTWVFQPGELCPATRVRFSRGPAWLEMSFDALTGNMVNETDYIP